MVLAGVLDAGPVATPKCDDCDDEANPADASHWCPNCKAHFCEDCIKPHFKRRAFKDHPLLTVEEHKTATGGAHGNPVTATEGCQLHHKPREYYCRSCHTIGCATCIISGHNGHDTGPLDEMVGPLRITLKQCGGPLGTRCKVLRAGMDSMQAMRAALDENEVAALEAVDQATTEARQELNKTATGAKTEVGAGFRSRFATTAFFIMQKIDPPYHPCAPEGLLFLHVLPRDVCWRNPHLPSAHPRTDSSGACASKLSLSRSRAAFANWLSARTTPFYKAKQPSVPPTA
jgi:hypothetical protein